MYLFSSVFDLKEVLANEFVEDLIEKSCSVEYTKGDPLDGYGDDEYVIQQFVKLPYDVKICTLFFDQYNVVYLIFPVLIQTAIALMVRWPILWN